MKSVEKDIELLARAIMVEAREEADQLRLEAQERAEAIRKRAQKEAEAERKAILARAKEDADRLRSLVIRDLPTQVAFHAIGSSRKNNERSVR